MVVVKVNIIFRQERWLMSDINIKIMEELKVKVKWLKDMINLHHQLGNKGLEQMFKLKLDKLRVEIFELIS